MKATIDRFEENLAVLLVRGDLPTVLNVPRYLLPEDCKEGDILDIGITRDVEAMKEAEQRVSGLIEKLKKKNMTGSIIKKPGKK